MDSIFSFIGEILKYGFVILMLMLMLQIGRRIYKHDDLKDDNLDLMLKNRQLKLDIQEKDLEIQRLNKELMR
jgi:hypothetical protein